MAGCIELTEGLNPSCDALNKVGGVNKRVWIAQESQIAGYTTDNTTKNIATVTMKQIPGTSPAEYYKLHQFVSKRDKHDFGVELVAGENVNVFNQQAILSLYAFTQKEQEAIEKLANADDLVVFYETNAGQIKVSGIDIGLNATAMTMREGILLNDPTVAQLTLEGEEKKLPQVMFVTSLADTIAYLDAKNGSAA
jgi:hypothetical protein